MCPRTAQAVNHVIRADWHTAAPFPRKTIADMPRDATNSRAAPSARAKPHRSRRSPKPTPANLPAAASALADSGSHCPPGPMWLSSRKRETPFRSVSLLFGVVADPMDKPETARQWGSANRIARVGLEGARSPVHVPTGASDGYEDY